MQTTHIEMPRAEARRLYREYKKHRHYSDPMDWEIQRAYQLLAQGRLVIKALDSIAKAGLDDKGLPKLAIARADYPICYFTSRHDGSAVFTVESRWSRRENAASSKWIDLPSGALPTRAWKNAQAFLPPVPLHLRPQRGLQNYHILWEAEWTPTPPRDPYLLRRIGEGDMWLVVAMWDLTEVERAVMASRIASA